MLQWVDQPPVKPAGRSWCWLQAVFVQYTRKMLRCSSLSHYLMPASTPAGWWRLLETLSASQLNINILTFFNAEGSENISWFSDCLTDLLDSKRDQTVFLADCTLYIVRYSQRKNTKIQAWAKFENFMLLSHSESNKNDNIFVHASLIRSPPLDRYQCWYKPRHLFTYVQYVPKVANLNI